MNRRVNSCTGTGLAILLGLASVSLPVSDARAATNYISGAVGGVSNMMSDTVVINGNLTVNDDPGYFVLYAENIIVSNFTINADGVGYGGGGGGGGGGKDLGGSGGGTGHNTDGGQAAGASGGTTGANGGSGGGDGITESWTTAPANGSAGGGPGNGGSGGDGGGPYGGAGGTGDANNGNPGADGGYSTTGGNNDADIGTFFYGTPNTYTNYGIWRGSGSGGGAGGYGANNTDFNGGDGGASGSNGDGDDSSGGGGGGAAGGGAIVLHALKSLTMTNAGAVTALGTVNGGSAQGAGGGIVLIGADVDVDTSFDNRGGGSQASNGGTIKIWSHSLGSVDTNTCTFDDGAFFMGVYTSRLSISSTSVIEGDSGNTDAILNVSLWPPCPSNVTVQFAAVEDSATEGVDFVATNGTLSFSAWETGKTVTVEVIGDTNDLVTESFWVELSNPTNAILNVASNTCTITDDDAPLPDIVSSIGINFVGNGGAGGTLGTNYAAGFIVHSNWNNMCDGVANETVTSITNAAGQEVSGMVVATTQWDSPDVSAAANEVGAAHTNLFEGFLNDNENAYVDVTNVPYAVFDLYIYLNSANNSHGEVLRPGGGETFYWLLGADPAFTVYDPSTDTNGPSSSSSAANTIVFSNMTASTFQIYANRNSGQIGFSGIQIVKVDVPAEIEILTVTDGDTDPTVGELTDFGAVDTVAYAVTNTLTITNSGDAVLYLTGGSGTEVGITGHTGDFTADTSGIVTNIAAGASTTFKLIFDPTTTGTRTGVVSIANSDSDENPYDFYIQGTGIVEEIEILTVTDGDTDPTVAELTEFGDVYETGYSVTNTLTITNSGTAVLYLTGGSGTEVGITGHTGDFTADTSGIVTNIAAGASTTFKLIFDPTTTGTRTGVVSIANSDSDENPYNFYIQGTGVVVSAEIEVLTVADGDTDPTVAELTDFGDVYDTGYAVTNTLTITNSGVGILYLTGGSGTEVGITGHTGDFTADTSGIVTNIAAGASTTFKLIFDPTTTGTRTGVVSIANSDSDENPYDFYIQGTGVVTSAEIEVLTVADGDTSPSVPELTDFGSVNTSGFAVTNTLTITNSGVGTLYLTGGSGTEVGITGDTGDFTADTSGIVTNIAAGASTTFKLIFDPTTTGTRTGVVSIANNDSGEDPYDFYIEGEGFVASGEIALFSNATEIVDGDTSPTVAEGTDFGSEDAFSGTGVTHTFTITNSAGDTLLLIGGAGSEVTLTGDTSEFTVDTTGIDSSIAAGGSTTFTIVFDPTSSGVSTGVVTILSSDADEGIYDFYIAGTGTYAGAGVAMMSTPRSFSTASEGPNYVDDDWTNLANLLDFDDNNRASLAGDDFDGNEYSYVLYATNFGFNIPTNTVIRGIKVEQRINQLTDDAVFTDFIQLVKDGVKTGTSTNTIAWRATAGEETHTYGDASYMWGTTLTPEDVNSPGFGIAMALDGGGASARPQLDGMRITIYVAPLTPPVIDPQVQTGEAQYGRGPNSVFLSDDVGYVFYVDYDGYAAYAKTSDGGDSWAAGNQLTGYDQNNGTVSIWYDRWTPGDMGSKIHISGIGDSGDDLYYSSFDTADDSFGGWTVASNGINYGWADDGGCSITKDTSGDLYIFAGGRFYNSLDTGIVCRSTDGGTNWTDIGASLDIDDNDRVQLLALDSDRVMLIQQDVSADILRSSIYSGSWSGWTTIDADFYDNGNFDCHWMATVSPETTNVYVVGHDRIDNGAGNVSCYVYTNTAGTWSENLITNDASQQIGNATVAIDANTDDLYAIYTRGDSDVGIMNALRLSALIRVYWRRSQDGGSTWSEESDPIGILECDWRSLRSNLYSDDRIFAAFIDRISGDVLCGVTVTNLLASDIEVYSNTTAVLNRDMTPHYYEGTYFGTVDPSGYATTNTFTLTNIGDGILYLTDATVVDLTGDTGDFSVDYTGIVTNIAAGASTTFKIIFDPGSTGTKTGIVSIANNEYGESPYQFKVEGVGGTPVPEIDVFSNTVEVVDGDASPTAAEGTSFGEIDVFDGAPVTHTFTITNSGSATLYLTGGTGTEVTMTGDTSEFSIDTSGIATNIPILSTTTFSITFDPTRYGVSTGVVSILNSDGDEGTYDFVVSGTGTADTISITAMPQSYTYTAAENPYDDVDWTTLTELDLYNDGQYATMSGGALNNGQYSHVLYVTNFGFRIPTNAVVTGFVITEDHNQPSTQTIDTELLQLVKGGVKTGTSRAGNTWRTTAGNETFTYGNATDMWGATFTAEEVNSPGFGFVYAVKSSNMGANPRLDGLKITVYIAALAPPVIDSTIITGEGQSGFGPSTVFVSDQVGYTFYLDYGGRAACRKTSDGGDTWSVTNDFGLDVDDGTLTVWYDQWTPGDSGTKVHIATVGKGGGDDLYYNYFDTADESYGSWVMVTNGTRFDAASDGGCSITKATSGDLFVYAGGRWGPDATWDTNIICRSQDNGASWSEVSSAGLLTDDNDFGQILPLSGGDIMLIVQDISADLLQSQVYDGSSWDGSWSNITTIVENGTWDCSWQAALNPVTTNIYLLAHTYLNNAAGEVVNYEFSDSSRTWSTGRLVVADSAEQIANVTIAIDTNTSHIYAMYTRGEFDIGNVPDDYSSLYDVYWRRSVDNGETWMPESSAINLIQGDWRTLRANMFSGERIYVTFTDLFNDMLCGQTVADLDPNATYPEIALYSNITEIVDGDTDPSVAEGTDFGGVGLVGFAATNMLTITNSGDGVLYLTGTPLIDITGDTGDFTADITGMATNIAAGASTTFKLVFDPIAEGTRTGVVTIVNDDLTEYIYDFCIKGTGTIEPVVSNGVPSSSSATTAWLVGNLVSNGYTATTVYTCWGDNDAGTTKGSWDYVITNGVLGVGAFSNEVSGLLYGITNYYRCYATNAVGDDWADATTNFLTVSPTQYLAVTNTWATNVTQTSANLMGSMDATQSVFEVYLYWGVNSNANASAWLGDGVASNVSLGWFTNVTGQVLSNAVSSLTEGTEYYYTYMMTNAATSIWSSPTVWFGTRAAPCVSNGVFSSISPTAATLAGNLVSNGYTATTVYTYWGDNDAGTTKGNWDYVITNGVLGVGTFSANVTDLLYGQMYYYRCYATNAVGDDWANTTTNFLTVNQYEDWNPSNTSVAAWYDASETNTITASNGVVSEVSNKSTNGLENFPLNDIDVANTNVFSGAGPSTGVRTINDLNVLDFYGTNYLTARRSDFLVKFSPPYSIFMVMAIDNVDDAQDAILGFHKETENHWSFTAKDTVFSGHFAGTGSGNPTFDLTGGPYEGGTNVLSLVCNSTVSNVSVYMDGTSRASVSGQGNSPRALHVFNNRDRTTTNCPDGALGEFLLITNCVTNTRQRIEGYLAHKWGLADSLPADHPYKGAGVPLIATNTSATNITQTSANLLGSMDATQSVFEVFLYWGVNNNSGDAWLIDGDASSVSLGWYTNVVGQVLSNSVSSMTPGQTYYYTYYVTNAATNIWAYPNATFYCRRTDMEILTVADGDTTPSAGELTDFGYVGLTGYTATNTFTITNSGDFALYLTSGPNLSGDAGDFAFNTGSMSTNIPPGGSTTFDIIFDPTTWGPRTGVVSIANNDPDENPYDFCIRGVGVEPNGGIPFYETYEDVPSTMANTPGDIDGQHGWMASGDNSVLVQTGVKQEGSKAMSVDDGSVSNIFDTLTETNVTWEFWARSPHSDEIPNVPSGASAVFYVNASSNVVVYSNGTALALSGAVITNDTWVKFTVKADYTLQRWALWANDDMLMTNAAFYNAFNTNCRGIAYINLSTNDTCYVDDISLVGQAGDADGDGVLDDDEVIGGTDPNDSNSYVRIISGDITNTHDIVLNTYLGASRGFVILSTDTPGGTKSALFNVTNSGAMGVYWVIDTNAVIETPQRFYSIAVDASPSWTNTTEWAMYRQERTANEKYLVAAPVKYWSTNEDNLNSTLGQQLANGLFASGDTNSADRIRILNGTWSTYYLATNTDATVYWWDPLSGTTADVDIVDGTGMWVERGSGAPGLTNGIFVGMTRGESDVSDISFTADAWRIFSWALPIPKQHIGGATADANQLGIENLGIGGMTSDENRPLELGDQIWVWEDNTWKEKYWLIDSHNAAQDATWNNRWWDSKRGRFADFQLEAGKAYYYRHVTNQWGGADFIWTPGY